MANKMKGVTLHAKWDPKPGFKLGPKDIDKRQTYLGSLVYRHPEIKIEDWPIPKPGIDEVLIEVKACGICGSDVHMAQPNDEGYIFYPGLTGFPCILGHELSGVVVDAGKKAFDKITMKPYKGGEKVCTEEMVWCGNCRPCADGQPNHCEKLDEIGFNINGGFAKYIVLPPGCSGPSTPSPNSTRRKRTSSSPAPWSSRPPSPTTPSSSAAAASCPATTSSSSAADPSAWPPPASSSAPARPRSS